MKQALIPSNLVTFAAKPGLALHISGVPKASNLSQDMEQGFHVSRDGLAVSRAEQTPEERQLVLSYLLRHYPEHAMLILGKNGVLAAQAFLAAAAELDRANAEFKRGELKSVPHSRQREAALCEALVQMAASLNCMLEHPISIDSRGELRVVTKGKTLREAGSSPYGAEFVSWLNTANPRTGVAPGAHLLPESGWCYLNHFDAEKLVQRYAASLNVFST